MNTVLQEQVGAELDALREARTYKRFNTLLSPQGAVVEMAGRGEVVVLSSNNYLGLAGHPDVVRAGIEGLERYGAGTASVRFICGTFEPHLELEAKLADLSGTEAALTYVSCWNANEAAIPALTDASTVILSDELNHASIVDAIRLTRPASKAISPPSDIGSLRDGPSSGLGSRGSSATAPGRPPSASSAARSSRTWRSRRSSPISPARRPRSRTSPAGTPTRRASRASPTTRR
jgi:glycine C-acetyltransferase